MNEISNQTTARLSEKLYCNWLIMLVTMVAPISSHVKDKNSIFTARGEDMILVKGEIRIYIINGNTSLYIVLYGDIWQYIGIFGNPWVITCQYVAVGISYRRIMPKAERLSQR